MLSVYGIRHSKLSVGKVLYKWIKATCMHLCLQNDLAPRDILGIDLNYTDVLAADRRMEEIKLAIVENEVAS